METQTTNLQELKSSGVDFLTIVISKEEVLQNDTSIAMGILGQLTSDLSIAEYFREKIEIAFDGYNETTQDLWEIDAVRNYVSTLDQEFPYWLYFLSKDGSALYVIIKCFLLPSLTPAAELEYNGPRLEKYLERRGLPAMNQICEATGMADLEINEMTDRFFDYLGGN